MKCTALAVTALVAVASVASATDYQPALRALAALEPATLSTDTMAAGPTERHSHPVEAAADVAAENEPTAVIGAEGKKSKEWWGGLGWGRPWGGFGGWGGYGGWGRLRWRMGMVDLTHAGHRAD
uniref:Uncharacterized protein n=1 Tax=Peronospora matthiolae TaxID=2874970 RepID=A0AAV1UBS8_9STRA